MSKKSCYYIEYYDQKDDLLDCSEEFDTFDKAVRHAEESGHDFSSALIVQKITVGELGWELKATKKK